MALSKEDIVSWRGRDLAASDGSKLGSIDEIYLDQETREPEWALINTGLFGTKQTFVPLRNASPSEDALRVPYDKDQVTDAPRIDADGEMSQSEEAQLYRHYGLDYSEATSDAGTGAGGNGGPVGRDVSGPETDEAMTRSEEELRVGTTSRESGRARLRKYVVTENVTTTVPVQREEVRIEREPITDANRDAATSGADISEEEHEVVLHEEQVTVDKDTVAKERIKLGTDTVTEERQVDETVRKEQVEMLDADGEPGEGVDGQRGTDDGVDRR